MNKMASPQKEHGYTPIANEIVEALMKINLSACESRVLWFILIHLKLKNCSFHL